MKATSNTKTKLSEIHRLLSEAKNLYDGLLTQFQNEIEAIHDEGFSLGHCLRYGEIAASEVIDEIE